MVNENESYEFEEKELVASVAVYAENGTCRFGKDQLKHFEVSYDDEEAPVNKKNIDIKISTESLPREESVKTATEAVISAMSMLEIVFENGIIMQLAIPETSYIHVKTKEKEDEMRFVFSVHHEPDFDEEDDEENFDEDDFDSDDEDDEEEDD